MKNKNEQTMDYNFFSIETTGVNHTDKIVKVTINDGAIHTWLINPGMPIPPDATLRHGITDDMVAGCPRFGEVAKDILAYFDRPLCGWGIKSFDIPTFVRECETCGLGVKVPKVIDLKIVFENVCRSFNSSDALNRFTGGAEYMDDTSACPLLMPYLVEAAGGMASVEDMCCKGRIDFYGLFVRKDGGVCVNIGKYKGRKYDEVPLSFYEWVVEKSGMPTETKAYAKRIISAAQKGGER